MLALLLIAGAWAQGTVTLKEGTEDADKWTIMTGTTTVEQGVTVVDKDATVTLTYSGDREVKSITAKYTPPVVVNKLSEITDAIAALNMQPGGEYTLSFAFNPAKIETNPTGDDNKLYMSIPDDATLNLVFKNQLPDGTHLTIGDAEFTGMSEPEVEAFFTGKDEPESKNHLNLDFAGGTGSEFVDGSGLYMELITPYSTVATGSSSKKATRECKVGVEQTPRPSAISFETATASVPKGRAIILDPNIVIGNDAVSDGNYRLTFTTNSPGVVAVNDFGYVRGLQMGEAVVTAHYGPLSATCTVTVIESVDGMTHVFDNVVAGFIAESGDVLTGTLKAEYKIEITDGVTKVTANYAFDDIETSSSITIGGTLYWDGTSYQNNGENYLKQVPFVYEPGK